MFGKRTGRLVAVADKIRRSRLVRKIAESRVAKRISQSRVVRRTVGVFRVARYPTREEMWLIIRISILGILIVGGVAFFAKLVLSMIFSPSSLAVS